MHTKENTNIDIIIKNCERQDAADKNNKSENYWNNIFVFKFCI